MILSPFVQSDGTTEDTTQANNLLDGQDYEFIFHYQDGLTDAHIDDHIHLEIANDFAQSDVKPFYHASDVTIEGSFLKTWIADSTVLVGHFDSAKDRFYLAVKV